jgi:hypothetical protein
VLSQRFELLGAEEGHILGLRQRQIVERGFELSIYVGQPR